jgi:hypothetical protein
MANAPNTRFSATNVRVREPNGGVGLSKATSNGEVEGPPRRAAGASLAVRSLGASSALPDHRSRTAPTIVRGRPHRGYCARAALLQQSQDDIVSH